MNVKWKLILFLTIALFTVAYIHLIFPTSQPISGYSMNPDGEADYLISKRVAENKGLYSSFSIVYPPGRFLIQGLFFKIFGPTALILGVLKTSFNLIIFPILLFILAYIFFNKLILNRLNKNRHLVAYIFAIITSFFYLAFFRSAQEAHVAAALFLITLLNSKKLSKSKLFFLGLLLGLTFLFRIDAGVILSLSLIVAGVTQNKKSLKLNFKLNQYFYFGIAAIWFPIILSILINGSLTNFLYDTLILGLIVQPKFMGLLIEPRFKFIFWGSLIFLTTVATALFLENQNIKNVVQRLGIKTLAVFTILSYLSALGRSDEPHLWYGLIWLPLLLTYTFYKLFSAVIKLNKGFNFSWLTILVTGLSTLLYALLIIEVKSPNFFLLATLLIFIALGLKFKLKSSSINSILIGGTFSSLLIFHSLSFIKIKYSLPQPSFGKPNFSIDLLTPKENELAGCKLNPQSKFLLDRIRQDIPETEKYLFIFPKNLLLNEYLKLNDPSRYILLSLERTAKTENDVIQSLDKTNTRYVLYFPNSAGYIEGPTKDWIEQNTSISDVYRIEGESIELRVKK